MKKGMLRRVALVRTDVSVERIASIIRVTRNELLVIINVFPSILILFTLMIRTI
jgi:hypothetical protein